MSLTKMISIAAAAFLCLSSCDSGTGSAPIGPSNTGTPTSSTGQDTTFVGRWRIYAIPADTVEFFKNGKGRFVVDLPFGIRVDSFQWSAAGGAIHFAHADGKTEDGTYRFFGKDSFNMTLPSPGSLGTQLYLRLK